jgi:hypothetical protein
MGKILSISNFNAYTGRYSRKPKRKSVEQRTGWYVRDLFAQLIPVLALRAQGERQGSPFAWRNDRHLRHGIDLTLSTLKYWQAFRPFPSRKVIRKLAREVPKVVGSFQRTMRRIQARSLWELGEDREIAVVAICEAVQRLSALKNPTNPMLGSKVLHFLFPEFFPAWDSEWIKRKCLRYERVALSQPIASQLVGQPAAVRYAAYIFLLLRDLEGTSPRAYRRLKSLCLRYSSDGHDSVAWSTVIGWYFSDIVPILFEICLLGKHCEGP